MFTGIVEQCGSIEKITPSHTNLNICIKASFVHELKVDQSIAHNGACLTVTEIDEKNQTYWVTAISETIEKTSIGAWRVGDSINLERCLRVGDRLDGHIVQGHVDAVGVCANISEIDGSWLYSFSYHPKFDALLVEKGSICVNGVSLTIVNVKVGMFSVAIIPYTYHHTNFSSLTVESSVNLEFDIIGKYILKGEQINNV